MIMPSLFFIQASKAVSGYIAVQVYGNLKDDSEWSEWGMVEKEAAVVGAKTFYILISEHRNEGSVEELYRSLDPSSGVVAQYLHQSGVPKHLNQQGFNVVGYGCAKCFDNSWDFHDTVDFGISENDMVAAAVVLSDNSLIDARFGDHHTEVQSRKMAKEANHFDQDVDSELNSEKNEGDLLQTVKCDLNIALLFGTEARDGQKMFIAEVWKSQADQFQWNNLQVCEDALSLIKEHHLLHG